MNQYPNSRKKSYLNFSYLMKAELYKSQLARFPIREALTLNTGTVQNELHESVVGGGRRWGR
jgi:hypothetical protein